MNGDCKNIHAMLSAYAVGDASDAETEAVRLHRGVCEAARADLREIRCIMEMLPPAPDMSEDALERLRVAVRELTAQEASESDRAWLEACAAEVSGRSLKELRRRVRDALQPAGAKVATSRRASSSRHSAAPSVYVPIAEQSDRPRRLSLLLAASAAAMAVIVAGAWYAVSGSGGNKVGREAVSPKEIAKGQYTAVEPSDGGSGTYDGLRRGSDGDHSERAKESTRAADDREEPGASRMHGGEKASSKSDAPVKEDARDAEGGEGVGGAERIMPDRKEPARVPAAGDEGARNTGAGRAKPGNEDRRGDGGGKRPDTDPHRGVEPIPAPHGGAAIVVDRPVEAPRSRDWAAAPADGKEFVPSEVPVQPAAASLVVGAVIGGMAIFADGNWRDLKAGENLPATARISTGENSRGAVAVPGCGVLYLNQATRLSIALDAGKLTVSIEGGHFAYASADKSSPLPVAILSAAGRIEMPQGEIEAAILAPGDRLRLVLLKGTATIFGRFKATGISVGKMALVKAGEQPDIQDAPEIALQRAWRADIRVPTQYLSKDPAVPLEKSGRKKAGGGRGAATAPYAAKASSRLVTASVSDSTKKQ